ncbi:MAG: trypco2 family protein [Pseudomonadota bacterium]
MNKVIKRSIGLVCLFFVFVQFSRAADVEKTRKTVGLDVLIKAIISDIDAARLKAEDSGKESAAKPIFDLGETTIEVKFIVTKEGKAEVKAGWGLFSGSAEARLQNEELHTVRIKLNPSKSPVKVESKDSSRPRDGREEKQRFSSEPELKVNTQFGYLKDWNGGAFRVPKDDFGKIIQQMNKSGGEFKWAVPVNPKAYAQGGEGLIIPEPFMGSYCGNTSFALDETGICRFYDQNIIFPNKSVGEITIDPSFQDSIKGLIYDPKVAPKM